jgi:hypothetical protein
MGGGLGPTSSRMATVCTVLQIEPSAASHCHTKEIRAEVIEMKPRNPDYSFSQMVNEGNDGRGSNGPEPVG